VLFKVCVNFLNAAYYKNSYLLFHYSLLESLVGIMARTHFTEPFDAKLENVFLHFVSVVSSELRLHHAMV